MSNDKWSFLDELQRMAESYIHQQKPPSSISELFEMFEKVVPPAHQKGWSDFTDSPRAATPPPAPKEETPMRQAIMTDTVELYVCPAPDCRQGVKGVRTLEVLDTQPDAPATVDGVVNMNMKVVGVRAFPHDCTPTVTR